MFIDLNDPNLVVLFDGNSINAVRNDVPDSYAPSLELALREPFLSNRTRIINTAVPGQTTAAMTARAPLVLDPHISHLYTTILCPLEIGNTLYAGATAAEAVRQYSQNSQERRWLGADLVSSTLHARSGPEPTLGGDSLAVYQAKIEEANQLLRENWRGFADALYDCRIVPELTIVTPQYFPDDIHPNRAADALYTDGLIKTLQRIPKRR
jgi:hypothetical protein